MASPSKSASPLAEAAVNGNGNRPAITTASARNMELNVDDPMTGAVKATEVLVLR